jgi:uncharacterized protein YbaR (Trm112 family)
MPSRRISAPSPASPAPSPPRATSSAPSRPSPRCRRPRPATRSSPQLTLAEQTAGLGDPKALRARIAADPADWQARFDLALIQNGAGDREAAADLLLDIVRRNRAWEEEKARKQLVQFFEAWGPNGHSRRPPPPLLPAFRLSLVTAAPDTPDKAEAAARPAGAGINPKLLELLVCPLTKTTLEYDRDRQELISRAAKLAYPIRDGIPIMLPDEARPLE